MIYFIGDLHLGHTNIIRYCNRPFKSTQEMNDFMVAKWNETISNNDTVYYLGDIAYGRDCGSRKYWWDLLNGNKILIKGNHDRDLQGIPYHKYLIKRFNNIEFLLIHAPEYNDFGYKGWLIHGHHHNNYPELYPLINYENKTINVSAEVLSYKPISLEKILQRIAISEGKNERFMFRNK